jgi:hypothetical protein
MAGKSQAEYKLQQPVQFDEHHLRVIEANSKRIARVLQRPLPASGGLVTTRH